MSQYSEYFWNSFASIVQLDTLAISHPSFSKIYYVVRNAPAGLTAKLEDGTTVTFDYYPLGIKPTGAQDDLDQTMQIQLGDLGEVIPAEIDRCFADNTMLTKPQCVYRIYRSDDLTAPMDGPFFYEIRPISSKRSNQAFVAAAPQLNISRTGEIYTLNRFTPLAGFL